VNGDPGCFAGGYLGLNCGVESVRRKKDWVRILLHLE
jgi:hypothetical protein